MHTVLLGIGCVVAAYGPAQRAWTARPIGVALRGVWQLVKTKGSDTETNGN
ncbi:hypothetical protein ABTX85_27270 [Streptomyces sp. NPDC096097]|uniref:hypothetical protein n=1 Tax=Streptomyces sp. NPDC096097 TaxID=3155546 RepID=UPI0033325743